MQTLLLSAAVMAGHIAAVVSLYYVRISGDHPLVQTDTAVLYLPTLVALGLHLAVFRHSSRAVRVIAATAMSLIGIFAAILISLNSWGG